MKKRFNGKYSDSAKNLKRRKLTDILKPFPRRRKLTEQFGKVNG